MKLYDDYFYCFGCQSSGDAITLVEKLFGLQPLDAAKKLQRDFGLAEVSYDCKKEASVYRERQKSIRKELEFKKWKADIYLILTGYCYLLHKWKEEYTPKKIEEPLHPLFIEDFIFVENEKAAPPCDVILLPGGSHLRLML